MTFPVFGLIFTAEDKTDEWFKLEKFFTSSCESFDSSGIFMYLNFVKD